MHCNWGRPTPRQSLYALITTSIPSLKSFNLSAAVSCRFYCWYITLRCDLDLWPLTVNICSIPAVPWSNSVPNLSAIQQSAAELLWFQYLTLWPWTCVIGLCCARLWDNFHQVWTRSTYPFLTYSVFLLPLHHITLWPWLLTPWLWKFLIHRVSRGHSL